MEAIKTGVKTGTTGDCTWTLDENGLLTISGNGAMGNYTSAFTVPWGINIKSVVIENGVTTIGNSVFYNCTSLTSVTIPNSVTSIGEFSFANCWGLTSVAIPNSVTSIEPFAFISCISLTSITIPDSVTSIGDYAFRNCSSLTGVKIPNSVTSIGDYAFYDCLSLKEVKVPKGAIIGDKALGFKHNGEYCWNSCPVEDFTVTYQ